MNKNLLDNVQINKKQHVQINTFWSIWTMIFLLVIIAASLGLISIMGKKKQLIIVLVPPIAFPKNILSPFSEEKKELLLRSSIWDYLNFKLPKPNLNLISSFITSSEYGKMKEVFLRKRKISFTSKKIVDALHL